jgi:hypothetical protein
MEIVVAPEGVGVMVRAVALCDPQDPVGDGIAGPLLLAVGVPPDDTGLERLIKVSSTAGAVGVACRGSAAWRPEAIEAALASGLALIEIRGHVGWGEIYEQAEIAEANGLSSSSVRDSHSGALK